MKRRTLDGSREKEKGDRVGWAVEESRSERRRSLRGLSNFFEGR